MGPMLGLPIRSWLGENLSLWIELILATPVVVWAALWGVSGAFLAVPLTVILRIALGSQPSTQWAAVLLGPAVPGPKISKPERAPESV